MSNYYEEQVQATPVGTQTTVARRSARWTSPGCILAGLTGLSSGIIGLIVIVRNGIDGTLDTPTTSILGTNQSAIAGIVLFLGGLLLMLAAASEASRPVAGGVGVVMIILGVLGAAATDTLRADVGIDRAAGWLIAIIGAIAVVSAMLPARLAVHRDVAVQRDTIPPTV